MNENNKKDFYNEAEVDSLLDNLIKSLNEELEVSGVKEGEADEATASEMEVEPAFSDEEVKEEDIDEETITEETVTEDTLEQSPLTTEAEDEDHEDKIAEPIEATEEIPSEKVSVEEPKEAEVEIKVERPVEATEEIPAEEAEIDIEPVGEVEEKEIEKPVEEIDPSELVEEEIEYYINEIISLDEEALNEYLETLTGDDIAELNEACNEYITEGFWNSKHRKRMGWINAIRMGKAEKNAKKGLLKADDATMLKYAKEKYAIDSKYNDDLEQKLIDNKKEQKTKFKDIKKDAKALKKEIKAAEKSLNVKDVQKLRDDLFAHLVLLANKKDLMKKSKDEVNKKVQDAKDVEMNKVTKKENKEMKINKAQHDNMVKNAEKFYSKVRDINNDDEEEEIVKDEAENAKEEKAKEKFDLNKYRDDIKKAADAILNPDKKPETSVQNKTKENDKKSQKSQVQNKTEGNKTEVIVQPENQKQKVNASVENYDNESELFAEELTNIFAILRGEALEESAENEVTSSEVEEPKDVEEEIKETTSDVKPEEVAAVDMKTDTPEEIKEDEVHEVKDESEEGSKEMETSEVEVVKEENEVDIEEEITEKDLPDADPVQEEEIAEDIVTEDFDLVGAILESLLYTDEEFEAFTENLSTENIYTLEECYNLIDELDDADQFEEGIKYIIDDSTLNEAALSTAVSDKLTNIKNKFNEKVADFRKAQFDRAKERVYNSNQKIIDKAHNDTNERLQNKYNSEVAFQQGERNRAMGAAHEAKERAQRAINKDYKKATGLVSKIKNHFTATKGLKDNESYRNANRQTKKLLAARARAEQWEKNSKQALSNKKSSEKKAEGTYKKALEKADRVFNNDEVVKVAKKSLEKAQNAENKNYNKNSAKNAEYFDVVKEDIEFNLCDYLSALVENNLEISPENIDLLDETVELVSEIENGTIEEPKDEEMPELDREDVLGDEEIVKTDVKFDSLKEAYNLGARYFTTPSRVQYLQEKMALAIAEDNDDQLFQEMTKCYALAESFKHRLLNKYSIISENRTAEFLNTLNEEYLEEGRKLKKFAKAAAIALALGSDAFGVKSAVNAVQNDKAATEEIQNAVEKKNNDIDLALSQVDNDKAADAQKQATELKNKFEKNKFYTENRKKEAELGQNKKNAEERVKNNEKLNDLIKDEAHKLQNRNPNSSELVSSEISRKDKEALKKANSEKENFDKTDIGKQIAKDKRQENKELSNHDKNREVLLNKKKQLNDTSIKEYKRDLKNLDKKDANMENINNLKLTKKQLEYYKELSAAQKSNIINAIGGLSGSALLSFIASQIKNKKKSRY